MIFSGENSSPEGARLPAAMDNWSTCLILIIPARADRCRVTEAFLTISTVYLLI
jgi:hypothetical protein